VFAEEVFASKYRGLKFLNCPFIFILLAMPVLEFNEKRDEVLYLDCLFNVAFCDFVSWFATMTILLKMPDPL
jgi:hypothetical protein